MYIKYEAVRVLKELDATKPGSDEYDTLIVQLIGLGRAARLFPPPKGFLETLLSVQINGLVLFTSVAFLAIAGLELNKRRAKKHLDRQGLTSR